MSTSEYIERYAQEARANPEWWEGFRFEMLCAVPQFQAQSQHRIRTFRERIAYRRENAPPVVVGSLPTTLWACVENSEEFKSCGPAARATAEFLIKKYGDGGTRPDRRMNPKIATIARARNKSDRTIQRHLRELESKGVLVIEEAARADGSNTSNNLWVHPRLTNRQSDLNGI